MSVSEQTVIEKSPEETRDISFEEQTERLLMSCTVDQLKYLSDAIFKEQEFRKFSENRIHVLREKLKQMEKDFEKRIAAKKQLLASSFINGAIEESEESEEEEEEDRKSIKKRKASPSKKNNRKSK